MKKIENFIIVPCDKTYIQNITYRLYYGKTSVISKYEDIKYIGLYKDGVISYIGEVDKIVEGILKEKNLNILSGSNLMDDEKNRIEEAVKFGDVILNSKIENQSHKYFLVKKFVPTYFKKMSQQCVRRPIYKNIYDYLNEYNFNSVEEVAQKLENKIW